MGVTVSRTVKFIRKGVGIAYIDVEYADSTSNSVAPTSGWQTTAPAWQNGHYIWTRTHIVYTDGTDQYSNPVCVPSGKGIASIVEQYYQSTSATELVGGQWVDNTPPTWVSGKYIWTRSKITYTDGTVQYTAAINPTGQQGETGPQGPQGEPGVNYYTWIRYADTIVFNSSGNATGGTGMSNSPLNSNGTFKEYIGFAYNKTTATESDDYTQYKWTKFKGTDGTNGIDGEDGEDGQSLYTWIKYADSIGSNGYPSSMYDTPKTTTEYIGIAVNKTTQTESNTPSDYSWSKFKGDQGVQGPQGNTGPQGPQGNDGISYEIACTVGNVTIPADVDSALLNCTAAFYKKEGTAARTANMCYYAIYSRIGTTYALLSMQSGYSNNGYDDGVAIRGTVYTGYDAVVVFMFTSNYRDNNPAGQAYLAKCEIIVKKQGNTGPQGEQGPQGPQGPEGGTGSQGPRGYRGPALRGPQDWAQMDTDYQFYEGADGEPYEDFVIKDGTYYKCIKTHTKTLTNAPGSTYDTNNHLWQQTTKVGIVAANILFGNHGYFGSAIISGDWLISTNGTINGTQFNNGAKYNGIIAYSLFNPDRPLGGDISKYGYSGTYNFATSDATKSFDTVTLESGKVYFMEAVGKANSSSGSYYIRVRNNSTGATYSPIMINGTSNVTRSGLFNCTATGTYTIEIYNPAAISGTVTAVSLVERTFTPVYALDLLTGKVYENDAHVKGNIYRPPFVINNSNYSTYAPKTNDVHIIDLKKTGLNIQLDFSTSGIILIDFPTGDEYIGAEITIVNSSNQPAYVETILWGEGDASFGIAKYSGYAAFKYVKCTNSFGNVVGKWWVTASICDPGNS